LTLSTTSKLVLWFWRGVTIQNRNNFSLVSNTEFRLITCMQKNYPQFEDFYIFFMKTKNAVLDILWLKFLPKNIRNLLVFIAICKLSVTILCLNHLWHGIIVIIKILFNCVFKWTFSWTTHKNIVLKRVWNKMPSEIFIYGSAYFPQKLNQVYFDSEIESSLIQTNVATLVICRNLLNIILIPT